MSARPLSAPDIPLPARRRFLPVLLGAGLLLMSTLWAQTSASVEADGAAPSNPCDSLGPDMPRSDALRKVCEYAVSLPTRIPNFTCEQRTTRYQDGRAEDVVTAEVAYLDGQESYRNVKSNGLPVTDVGWLKAHTWSTGQFGADIRGLFDRSNEVSFELDDASSDSRSLAFHYEVAHQDVPFWQLHVWDRVAAPPYHGELRIDKKTGELRQLQVETTVLPEDFPLRSADLLIDYRKVPFGDGTSFLLPLKTVVNASARGGRKNRNLLEFHNCHKFRAIAHIMP